MYKKFSPFFSVWLLHIAFVVVLLSPITSIAQISYLSLKDGKVLSRSEFDALKPKISKNFDQIIDELNFNYHNWVYYKGDLKVNGNFYNSEKGIIVDGNLIVDGLYYDNSSTLIVLGNMQAQNVVTEYSFFIDGNLTSNGFVYTHNNDYALEVTKKITTKVMINYDRSISYKSLQAEMRALSDDDEVENTSFIEMANQLAPELYIGNYTYLDSFPDESETIKDFEFYDVPDSGSVIEFTKKNGNILRKSVTQSTANFNQQLAIASTKSTKNQLIKNTANSTIDTLVAMIYASRNDLPDEAISNLIKTKNDSVLQVLAANKKLKLKYFAEISDLSVNATKYLIVHKNATQSFIAGLVKHPNHKYRIAITKRYDLPLNQIEALALDSSLEVRKAIFLNQDFEKNQKVIDANIDSKDEELLLKLINKNVNFTLAHYNQLIANPNIEVRKQIGRNLIDSDLFASYTKSTEAERLTALKKLSKDKDLYVQAIGLAGVSAKEQEEAINNASSANKATLLRLIAPNVRSKKLALQIIDSNQFEAVRRLAFNDWLPEAIQHQLVSVYLEKNSTLKMKLSEKKDAEMQEFIDALFYRKNVFPSVLDKLSAYCFNHLYPPSACNTLKTQTHTANTVKDFENIKNNDFKILMYESIYKQAYASSEQLIKAKLVNENGWNKFLKKQGKKTESEFWNFLSKTNEYIGNKAAAINVNTPIETLKKLEQINDREVVNGLLKNPIVSIESKKNIMLKNSVFEPIQGVENDFYLNVLKGKIKTKEGLSSSEESDLNTILMDRHMREQFQ